MEHKEEFVNHRINNERELMLIAKINGEYIGNCSLMGIGTYKRYHHRCETALALYQMYCGVGIGKAMLKTIFSITKELGYEQANLKLYEIMIIRLNCIGNLGLINLEYLPII